MSIPAMLLLFGFAFVLVAFWFLWGPIDTAEISLWGFAFSVFPAIFAARAALLVFWEQRNKQLIYQKGLSPTLYAYPSAITPPTYSHQTAEKLLNGAIMSEIGPYPKLLYYASFIYIPPLIFLAYIWLSLLSSEQPWFPAERIWFIVFLSIMGCYVSWQALLKFRLNREYKKGLVQAAHFSLEYFYKRVQTAEVIWVVSSIFCAFALFIYAFISESLGYEGYLSVNFTFFLFIAGSGILLAGMFWLRKERIEKTRKIQNFLKTLENPHTNGDFGQITK